MEKEQYLKSLFDKVTAIKKRSTEILEEAKLSGKLQFSFLFIVQFFCDQDPEDCEAVFRSWSRLKNFSEAYKNFIQGFLAKRIKNPYPVGRGS